MPLVRELNIARRYASLLLSLAPSIPALLATFFNSLLEAFSGEVQEEDPMAQFSSLKAYRTYLIVWFSLILLTVATWFVSYVHLGMMNVTVAMLIASLKASLVALFFMHLRYENWLVWVFALTPLGFLLLIIVGTLGDTLFR